MIFIDLSKQTRQRLFSNGIAYGDFKYLRLTTSDKILRGKTFNISKYQKHHEY